MLTLTDDALTRFEEKIEKQPAGCWLWTAAKTSRGYGSFGVNGKTHQAHRIAYQLWIDDPEGFQVIHTCGNRLCVNPEHLELGLDLTRTLEDRFWSYVDRGEVDSCWEWQAGKFDTGYGMFYIGENCRVTQAHRVSWMIANQKQIPDGMVICHSCDNRGCVNPNHLRLGTYTDNNRDTVEHGRWVNHHANSKSHTLLANNV